MSNNISSYATYVLDLLARFSDIKMRKMFGGYGIYQENIFFAIIIDDILYFKVDSKTQSLYEQFDSEPFSYVGKNNKRITMSYWQVPSEILDNSDQFDEWVSAAVLAAKKSKK